MKAVAAKNLHGFIHHEIEQFRAVYLADGTFDGVFLEHFHGLLRFVRAVAGRGDGAIHESGRAVNHGLDRKNANGHLGQLFADQAEIADGLAEGEAFLGVFRGDFQRASWLRPCSTRPG